MSEEGLALFLRGFKALLSGIIKPDSYSPTGKKPSQQHQLPSDCNTRFARHASAGSAGSNESNHHVSL